jgi:hypothetical protein
MIKLADLFLLRQYKPQIYLKKIRKKACLRATRMDTR